MTFQFDECEKIIIFGSSKNLIIADHWKKRKGTAWIMINHAWQIRRKYNDWDKIVCTDTYLHGLEGDKDIGKHVEDMPIRYGNFPSLLKYPTLKNKYLEPMMGGVNGTDKFIGTMFFNACYYGIEMYQPSKIGFVGCDMDYKQYSEGEANAFFGIATPDPFLALGSKEAILERLNILEDFCKKEEIELVNLSTADWTILPFKKETYENF
tara:strand:+ start:638 stop:1264 length:627 start_codon:yes stop_codon:yes gene_type:complete